MFEDRYSYWCPVRCSENKTDLYRDYILTNTKPDWCPLNPAPEHELLWHDDESDDWARGYNACLDEILGGSDYE